MILTLPFRKLAAAALFVSRDETRFVLTGVRVEPKPYGVLLIATDGRRAVFIRHETTPDPTFKDPIMIPAALINRLGIRTADEVFFDEEAGQERQPTEPPYGDCVLTVTDKDVSMRLEKTHGVIGELIEDNYPDMSKVIPTIAPRAYVVACFNASFMADYATASRWLAPHTGAILMAGHEQAEGTPHARVLSVRLMGCPDFYSVLMPVRESDAFELVTVPAWLKP